MRGMKRLIPLLTAGGLLLTACQDGGGVEESIPPVEELPAQQSLEVETTPTPAQETATPGQESLIALREQAAQAGAHYIVGFLGYGRSIEELLDSKTGLRAREAYPFLGEIGQENWILHPEGGEEVYCVLPVDEADWVSVWNWKIDAATGVGSAAEVLYTAQPGQPVLIWGNLSDIVPSFALSTAGGGVDELYEPSVSLQDGSLVVPEDGSVWDMTLYNDPAFLGRWTLTTPSQFGEGDLTLTLLAQRGGDAWWTATNADGTSLHCMGSWYSTDGVDATSGEVTFEFREIGSDLQDDELLIQSTCTWAVEGDTLRLTSRDSKALLPNAEKGSVVLTASDS